VRNNVLCGCEYQFWICVLKTDIFVDKYTYLLIYILSNYYYHTIKLSKGLFYSLLITLVILSFLSLKKVHFGRAYVYLSSELFHCYITYIFSFIYSVCCCYICIVFTVCYNINLLSSVEKPVWDTLVVIKFFIIIFVSWDMTPHYNRSFFFNFNKKYVRPVIYYHTMNIIKYKCIHILFSNEKYNCKYNYP